MEARVEVVGLSLPPPTVTLILWPNLRPPTPRYATAITTALEKATTNPSMMQQRNMFRIYFVLQPHCGFWRDENASWASIRTVHEV